MRLSRFTGASPLAVVAALLAVAFVAAPRILAARGSVDFASEDDIRHALRQAFAGYYGGSGRGLTSDLQQIVDYWFRYHVAKAVFAALLLAVLAALAVALWRRGGTAPRIVGALASVLAMFAALLVMANLQGAAVPFAALFPMLLGDSTSDDAALRLDSGATTAPLDVMVDEFARYHVAMAVISTVLAIAVLVAEVTVVRRFARSSEPRPVRIFVGAGAILVTFLVVLVIANATTAADPVPGLLALLQGGW